MGGPGQEVTVARCHLSWAATGPGMGLAGLGFVGLGFVKLGFTGMGFAGIEIAGMGIAAPSGTGQGDRSVPESPPHRFFGIFFLGKRCWS